MFVVAVLALLAFAVARWLPSDSPAPAGSDASAVKSSAEVELANRTLKVQGFPSTFCDHQKASARGTAAYVVVLTNGASKIEAIKAVYAHGARVIGPLPPNALLVETSIFALGRMSVDARFAAASEWLPEDKVDARLKPMLASGPDTLEVTVVALASDDVGRLVTRVTELGGARVAGCLNGKTSVTLRLPRTALAELVERGDVRWIEPFQRPKLLNDCAVGPTAMNVRSVWEAHGLTGTDQLITTSDSGIDTGNLETMHRDLRNRIAGFKVSTSGECYSYDANGHGTHTAGSIVGDGTESDGAIRGVAYGAKLWAWFCGGKNGYIYTPGTCAELFRPSGATNACIHSASWGIDDYGAYTSQCQSMDEYVWDHPEFLPVVANGNAGSSKKTVGSPATAKNVLAVGATQNARTDGALSYANGDPTQTATYSSRGPCADGRIKPDLAAPGSGVASTRSRTGTYAYGIHSNTNYAYDSGTSMATPLTAGAAALVRQWLVERRGFTNAPPSAALVKAVLTGGAKGVSVPDNNQGWGRVDLGESLYPSNRAVRLIDRIPFVEGYTYACTVTLTNAASFDAQLVWIDYPATLGAASMLVNDLDLVVSNRATGAVWYGNDASGGDRVNTLESVRIANAEEGEYAVYVKSHSVTYGSTLGGAAALYLRGVFSETNYEATAALVLTDAVPSAATLTSTVGATNDFAVTVVASNGVSVAYSWTVDGVSVSGAATNRFAYVPAWSDRGSRVVGVVASAEGGSSVSRAWVVSVLGIVEVDAATGDDATATGETDRPYATISAALAGAQANETVRVGPGTYPGNITVPATVARLESRNGPASTIIDGGGTNRCIDCSCNMDLVLSGFTLTNGWLKGDDYYYPESGAGTYCGVLTNCTIVDCTIEAYGYGGGAYYATLTDCCVRDCFAGLAGGGLFYCTANYCTLSDNAADWFTSSYGGGAARSTLTHCTVYGNLAAASGGGVDSECVCRDAIVWDNEIESGEVSNWEKYISHGHPYVSTFSYSCTTPTGYTDGGGNTNGTPRWVNAAEGDFRLGTGSPCLGTASDGTNMGAWQGAGVSGHVLTTTTVGAGEITPDYAFVTDGESATFTASTHHPFRIWTTNGVLTAVTTNVFVWTDVHADGVISAAFGPTNFFVDAVSGDDASNGWSWAEAKRTLQAAVEVAADGETVSVNPGVYTGTVVATAAKIDVIAVGGPEKTVILGEGGTNRCVSAYLSPTSRFVGFTLENGSSEENFGGAVFYGTFSNCVIRNCRAALGGGGAYGATLIGCTIADCTAGEQGGGAYGSTLVNCTVRGNQAKTLRSSSSTMAGGGVDYQCVCTNTVLWGNVGPLGAEDNWEAYVYRYRDSPWTWSSVTYVPYLYWSCTRPYDSQGSNSFTNDPQFVSVTNTDARVYETSPCIGTGYGGANVGACAGPGVARVLPTLPENPTGEQVSQAVASVGYADTNVVAGIGTNAATYAQFSAWTTNGLTSKAVALSLRAFDSFTVRELVAEPTLLVDGQESEIKLTALVPASDGTCSTVVTLTDGDKTVPLAAKTAAAKAAFAAKTRVGTEPSGLSPAAVDRVSAESVGDGAVKLTITPPELTSRYFMRFDIR